MIATSKQFKHDKIWIVESDEGVRTQLEALLKQEGAIVQSFATTEDMLHSASNNNVKPHLLVADHLSAQKASQAISDATPVVVYSTAPKEALQNIPFGNRFTYVDKGPNIQSLLTAIDTMLDARENDAVAIETPAEEKPAILIRYAVRQNEAVDDYNARLDKIASPYSIALQAARIVAKAMEVGIYHPDPALAAQDGNEGAFQEAIDAIAKGLGEYDKMSRPVSRLEEMNAIDNLNSQQKSHVREQLKGMTGMRIDDEKMEQAQNALRRMGLGAAKSIVQAKAQRDALATIVPGLGKAWQTLKQVMGLQENCRPREVIEALYENGEPSPISDLASSILSLRDECKKFTAKQK